MRHADDCWRRAQGAFDARRDPLRDEDLMRELVDQPNALEELLALRTALGALAPPVQALPTRSPRRVAAWLAVAAVLLVALLFGLSNPGDGRSPTPARVAEQGMSAPPPPVHAPSTNRLLFLSMTTVTRAPHETRIAHTDGRTLRREAHLERAAAAHESSTPSALATCVVASITHRYEP